ncbi:MAG TPA: Fe2+-dependent dioxygenase [Rhizomicrobium sp.]|jgi:PKHD-type hydroxylase|nr:Fe2+-dependent dioxygenase [Rhizomicrobium sp.]
MFLLIKDLLTGAEVDQIRQAARTVRFIDGRASNPHNIAKHNLQADMTQAEAQRCSQIAGAAVARNEELQNFAFPKRIATPLLSRYEPGMKYGVHTDAAFLPLPTAPLRSDVSATLFIGDPSSYEGGELVIHQGSERIVVKGEPGSMIVYPSTTLHEVNPVTKGERLGMFTFIESNIPDQMHRELLYQLNEVHALEGLTMKWENRTRLQFVAANLQRMWSR